MLRAVDLLVNNAGLVKGRETVGDVSNDDIDVMINTNVIGMMYVSPVSMACLLC